MYLDSKRIEGKIYVNEKEISHAHLNTKNGLITMHCKYT